MNQRWWSALAVLACIVGTVLVPGVAQADEARDKQWYLSMLRIDQAHAISQGDGVVVAVIDSGVDASHPDLVGNVLPGKNMTGPDDKGWDDQTGHGTSMAAVIAGHGHGTDGADGILGIAPKAKILPITVPEGSLTPGKTYMSDAIDWAVKHGATVINISMSEGYDSTTHAITNATEAGVTVVVAAGNTVNGHADPGPLATDIDVVAVSAIGPDGQFSDVSVSGPEIMTSAPGVNVPAIVDRSTYRYDASGTSSPAAIVSGTFALVKAKHPDDSWKDLGLRVLGNTIDKGTPGRDNFYGVGVIDPVAALTGEPKPLVKRPNASSSPSGPAPQATTPPGAALEPKSSNTTTIVLVAAVAVAVLAAVLVIVLVARKRARQGGGTP